MPSTNYYKDIYKRRANWLGANSKDQYVNIAKKYFEDYLLTSPTADTILLDGISIQAGIQTNKQDESLVSKFFLVGLDKTPSLGSVIDWDGSKWIVVRKENTSFEAYQKLLTFRCNYSLKWVDSLGILNESPAYLFGHMENKSNSIEEGFRQWHGVYSPFGTKYIQVITPFVSIPLEQRFIINGEGWKVVKKDLISVNGILYINMVEDRIDLFNDDLVNGIANNLQLNNSYIDLGLTNLSLGVNDNFTFSPVLYQEGVIIPDATFEYSASNTNISITNATVFAGPTVGTSVLTVSSGRLISNCSISVITSQINMKFIQVVGDNNIKHGRTRTYSVFSDDGTTRGEIAATFEVLNNSTNLVTISNYDSTSCSLIANTLGEVGEITLKATTAYGSYTKTISVVSIW